MRALSDDEEPTESEMTLYFVNGDDIPYIALSDFMYFLADLEKAVADWDVSYDVLAGKNEVFLVSRSDNDSKMIVNAKDDIILFTNFDLFISWPDSTALVCVLDLDEPETMDPSQKLDMIMRRIQEGDPLSDEEIAKLMSNEEAPVRTCLPSPPNLLIVPARCFDHPGRQPGQEHRDRPVFERRRQCHRGSVRHGVVCRQSGDRPARFPHRRPEHCQLYGGCQFERNLHQ